MREYKNKLRNAAKTLYLNDTLISWNVTNICPGVTEVPAYLSFGLFCVNSKVPIFSCYNRTPIIMSEIWSIACFCLSYSSRPCWGLIVPQFAPKRRLITKMVQFHLLSLAISSHKTISKPSLSQKDAKPISKNKTINSKTFIFICKIILSWSVRIRWMQLLMHIHIINWQNIMSITKIA